MPFWDFILVGSGGIGSWGGWSSGFGGIAHEDDHEGYGLARLIQQYQDTPRIQAFLGILLNGEAVVGGGPLAPTGVQSAEDLAWQCYTERGIVAVEGGGPAVGEQLDVLGRIVGLERLDVFGGSDDIYRAAISIQIQVNRSNGRLPEILHLLDLAVTLSGSTDPVGAHEWYPAAFKTSISELPGAVVAASIWQIVRAAKPAGVRWDFLWSIIKEEYIFTYSSEIGATEPSTDNGYADDLGIPPVAGGRYMGMLT